MQFKNPEVFYFLVVLIIPILVHLFQLQKYVKIPFTNVAFLQKIQQQTRKSSSIKKWLILTTRLLLLLAILFAFSKPYLSNIDNTKKQHYFIYLDNSLSLSAKGERGNLLQIAIQDIIENANEAGNYSLLTNTEFNKNLSASELKNQLLKTKISSKSVDLPTILLKIQQEEYNKTNTLNNNILISDFQYTYKNKFTNVTPAFSSVKLTSNTKDNLSIDSLYINNSNASNFIVNIIIKNQGKEKNNVPIALYNKEKLISKQSFSINKDSTKIIHFPIQNSINFQGKVSITFSDTFLFDNDYFFTINTSKKIPVLCIGKSANYLSKIYTSKEFLLTYNAPNKINYNAIAKQQLIVLHELENIPEILIKRLVNFLDNGGSIVLIPNETINYQSYNSLFKNFKIGSIQPKIKDTLRITKINYDHPIFKNVFSKKVSNFQYPTVYSYYPITNNFASNIVSFENNFPFVAQINNKKLYFLSSSLEKNNSNFTNSPLIVPVFYNFGKMSFQYSKEAYRIGNNNQIEIETQLEKDEILNISDHQTSFIPLQQTFQNKVVITTEDQPLNAGIYGVYKENKKIENIAFNYAKEESLLQFLNLQELKKTHKNTNLYSTVAEVFKEINKNNEVHWLWKWFLAIAIVSLCLEILILKFYKP